MNSNFYESKNSGKNSLKTYSFADLNLSTGIAEIDAQHYELIDRLNELNNLLITGLTLRDINGFLEYIENYAALHFLTEETYMDRFDYPDKEEHKKQHAEFCESFRNFKILFEKKEQISLILKILNNEILEWFEEHFEYHDIKLATYLLLKGA